MSRSGTPLRRDGRTAGALLAVYLAWGATYPAIQVLDRSVPPLLGMGARFLAGGLLLYGYLLARGGRGRVRASLASHGGAALAGVWIIGDIGLIAVAEQRVPAGLAALLIASVPLWVVIIRTLARPRPGRLEILAVVVGFAGIALVTRPDAWEADGWMMTLLLAAAVLEASGEVYSTRLPQPDDALLATAVQLVGAGTVLIAAGVGADEQAHLHLAKLNLTTLAAFAFLVTVGSVLAYTAFVWLLQHQPVSTVATYAYVNPIVAAAIGWALLGESLTAFTLGGGALILISVAVVIRCQRHPDPERLPKRASRSGRVTADR
ncbi:MAG TPA: EamA family transporter [Trebonia sp.]|jgi:drug/metabolite transporter (DMT)-like permease|nr:EamA family transporter [Trebonia sp.]